MKDGEGKGDPERGGGHPRRAKTLPPAPRKGGQERGGGVTDDPTKSETPRAGLGSKETKEGGKPPGSREIAKSENPESPI